MGEISHGRNYFGLKKQTQKHGNGFKETDLTEKPIELERRTEIFLSGSAGADLHYMLGLARDFGMFVFRCCFFSMFMS